MPLPPEPSQRRQDIASEELRTPVRQTHQRADLLFDEADALFSKRSEVRDAHDRYSNDTTDLDPHKP